MDLTIEQMLEAVRDNLEFARAKIDRDLDKDRDRGETEARLYACISRLADVVEALVTRMYETPGHADGT